MRKKLKKFFSTLGPGFITGASDDDPSGIATYAQTGAIFGYRQLWTAVFTFPFMSSIQEMCGRIGLVTGKGLSGVIRAHYSRPLLYMAVLLLVAANIINIGADLGAMAAALALMIDIPFIYLVILMTAVTLILEIFVSYKTYARVLKYLTLSLFAYIITAFIVRQDWRAVAYDAFVPTISLSREYLMNVVAILGTTISPYLFFWQTNEEVEEQVVHHKLRMMGKGIPKVTNRDITVMQTDTIVGMFFSNIVMFFIIATTAATLHASGVGEIQTAAQAAEALRPLVGNWAFLLFAAGIVGTGLLAVPILAGSASYAIAEVFGWKEGLSRKFAQARGFYGVIIAATIFGLAVNFTPIPPFKMLYYTAIFNGIAAPPLLILILLIANNKKIMGQYTNPTSSNIMGTLITAIMGICAVALVAGFFIP